MKSVVTALWICAAALAQTAAPPVKVFKIAPPEKALVFQVVVPAKPDEVWTAFTTSEGLKTWLWRDCVVDLRNGGEWTVNYPGGTTGGGTIVSFEPGKRVTLRALAPEKFPEVRRTRTTATFEFAAEGEGTKVTLTQTGWKEGAEWDAAYDYLAGGNAQLLGQLYRRFTQGPLKWQ
jgi:uncharacterized protein YndB with AHSA1/START domain